MHITFAPRGILQIDDAMITFKNFKGIASQYNRAGDRSFALVIPDENIADQLVKDGWNVKIRPPRDEDDTPFMYLNVKVKFNDYGPAVYLKTGNRTNRLNDETIGMLDDIRILSCDMDIRPYDWVIQEGTPNEKRGRAAYLSGMSVEQGLDRFASRYESDGPDYDDKDMPF